MKKILFMFIALMSVLCVNAQNYAGSSKFFDNWWVGVNGGIQTNLHDWNAPQGAIAGISAGKDITPIFGIGADVNVGFNNNANWICENDLGGFFTRHQAMSCYNGTAIENLSAFLNGRVNLTNAILGYKGQRRPVEVTAVAGVGYTHLYDNIENSGNDGLLTKAGLDVDCNISDALTLRLSPAVVWNTTVMGCYDCNYAVGQLTLGMIYHFKTSNGTHHIVKAHLYDQAEIDALNARINELQNRPANVVEKVVEKTITIPSQTYVVSFPFDSSELNTRAKSDLDAVPSNATVNIVASASPEGTVDHNIQLSQERANAVKAYLENRGVKVNSADGVGVYDDASNRIAVVTIAE